jgi:hypothetical protein
MAAYLLLLRRARVRDDRQQRLREGNRRSQGDRQIPSHGPFACTNRWRAGIPRPAGPHSPHWPSWGSSGPRSRARAGNAIRAAGNHGSRRSQGACGSFLREVFSSQKLYGCRYEVTEPTTCAAPRSRLREVAALFLKTGLMFARLFAKVINVDRRLLVSLILIACTVGPYAMDSDIFDTTTCMFFGFIGYVMIRYEFPVSPMVLAQILGVMMESKTNGRRSGRRGSRSRTGLRSCRACAP